MFFFEKFTVLTTCVIITVVCKFYEKSYIKKIQKGGNSIMRNNNDIFNILFKEIYIY